MWRTGAACESCAGTVQDEAADRRRADRGDCGARIMLIGHVLTNGLASPAAPRLRPPPTDASAPAARQQICTRRDGVAPCTRDARPRSRQP